jgi:Spy/CpxP family protein refolding chaperone
MKKNSMITVISIISVWLFAVSASAQMRKGAGGMMGMGMGPGGNYMMQGLNLSQEQMQQLTDLQSRLLNDISPLRLSKQKKKLELQSIMLETNPDLAKAKTVQKEMFDLKSQIAEKRLEAQIDARKILTDRQKAQLPPGCTFGFGNIMSRPGRGPCGKGMGPGRGSMGPGRGYGRGDGPRWW